jgi:LytS/YehU family sensor histidine kinase
MGAANSRANTRRERHQIWYLEISRPGEIMIASRLTNGELVVTIANHGQIEQHSESTGLGLKNADDRLHRLFDHSASISLEQSAHDLVTAIIRLSIAAESALKVSATS